MKIKKYNEIIQSFNKLEPAQNATSPNKTFNQAYQEKLDKIYNIIVEMCYFKKHLDGDLECDYGNGILIKLLFERIISDNIHKSIEKERDKYFRELDDYRVLELGFKPYHIVQSIYEKFEIKNPGTIKTPIEGISEQLAAIAEDPLSKDKKDIYEQINKDCAEMLYKAGINNIEEIFS